jgi:hypothetical protein
VTPHAPPQQHGEEEPRHRPYPNNSRAGGVACSSPAIESRTRQTFVGLENLCDDAQARKPPCRAVGCSLGVMWLLSRQQCPSKGSCLSQAGQRPRSIDEGGSQGVSRCGAVVRADWRRAKISNSAPLPPLALNSDASTTFARTLNLAPKQNYSHNPPAPVTVAGYSSPTPTTRAKQLAESPDQATCPNRHFP